ncbi:hypothetical protein GAY28_00365 [Azospirillum brasilense]|nr:hypothetical protein [Azospirillum brasilense]
MTKDYSIGFSASVLAAWKNDLNLFKEQAKLVGRKASDPLFRGRSAEMRQVAAEVGYLLNRHGHLIETVLVEMINQLSGWSALHEAPVLLPGTNGQEQKRKVDCLAFNHTMDRLWVLECKRGHRRPGNTGEIEERVLAIAKCLNKNKSYKEWFFAKATPKIISYYGTTWKTKKVKIITANDIDALFGHSFKRAYNDFVILSERSVDKEFSFFKQPEERREAYNAADDNGRRKGLLLPHLTKDDEESATAQNMRMPFDGMGDNIFEQPEDASIVVENGHVRLLDAEQFADWDEHRRQLRADYERRRGIAP